MKRKKRSRHHDTILANTRCLEPIDVMYKSGKLMITNNRYNQLHFSANDLTLLSFEDCVVGHLLLEQKNTIQKIEFKNCIIGRFEIPDKQGIDSINFDKSFLLNVNSMTVSTINLNNCFFKELRIDAGITTLNLHNSGTEQRNNHRLIVKRGLLQINISKSWINELRFEEIKNNFFSNHNTKIKLTESTFDKINFPFSKDIRSEITSLEIVNCYIRERLWVRNITFKTLEIKGDNIIPAFVNDIVIDELTNWNRILISNIIGSIHLIKLTTDKNKNQLIFEKFFPAFFTIEDCILDQTSFNRVEIDGVVTIRNSSLTQANIYSITWPRNYRVNEKINEVGSISISQRLADLRETYRQLKVLSLKAENKIDAKFFLNSEVRVYYKLLTFRIFGKISKTNIHHYLPFNLLFVCYSLFLILVLLAIRPAKNRMSKLQSFRAYALSAWHEFGNWLILHTNFTFSKFGESLGRPIVWMLAFHSLFFYLLVKKFKGIGIEINLSNWENHDWNIFLKGMTIFVNLLSPVHGNTIPSIIYPHNEIMIFSITDFIMRISSGYFIYYFIRATRKFNFSI